MPACRAFVKPIELVTGKEAYYIGKPNPLMMRTGLNMLGVHSQEAVMIGDRMDTDIVAGIESGLDTALVLSGVSTRETAVSYTHLLPLPLSLSSGQMGYCLYTQSFIRRKYSQSLKIFGAERNVSALLFYILLFISIINSSTRSFSIS